MASIQHQDARKILKVIQKSLPDGIGNLTYREVARQIGRIPPEKHSRTVAQMCDLLDAAAALAGVPLLALVAVRESFSGEINQHAWRREPEHWRDAIIQRSLNYQFTLEEIKSIARSLDDLGDRGNRAAWQYVFGVYPGDLLFRRLMGDYSIDFDASAIDDLGSDAPDRARAEVWTYSRDPAIRTTVLARANGRCEYCQRLGFLKPDGSRYLECHHIIALASEGADRLTNVIGLCPNDHREAHFGKESEAMEIEMIARVRSFYE